MRPQYPLTALLSAAALLAACETNTSPEISPDDPEPSVLNVAPTFATVEGRRFVKLTAIPSGSAAEALQELVTWTSSDTNVATVTRGGLVEGRKAGRVLITASLESARGSATVVVLNPIVPKPGSPPCVSKGAQAALRISEDPGKC